MLYGTELQTPTNELVVKNKPIFGSISRFWGLHQTQSRGQSFYLILTCTRDSARLIFNATSSLINTSGYRVFWNNSSKTSSCCLEKVVLSLLCFLAGAATKAIKTSMLILTRKQKREDLTCWPRDFGFLGGKLRRHTLDNPGLLDNLRHYVITIKPWWLYGNRKLEWCIII